MISLPIIGRAAPASPLFRCCCAPGFRVEPPGGLSCSDHSTLRGYSGAVTLAGDWNQTPFSVSKSRPLLYPCKLGNRQTAITEARAMRQFLALSVMGTITVTAAI